MVVSVCFGFIVWIFSGVFGKVFSICGRCMLICCCIWW